MLIKDGAGNLLLSGSFDRLIWGVLTIYFYIVYGLMSKYCIGVDVKFDPFFRMVLGMELVILAKLLIIIILSEIITKIGYSALGYGPML
jgi:hypothetical protein